MNVTGNVFKHSLGSTPLHNSNCMKLIRNISSQVQTDMFNCMKLIRNISSQLQTDMFHIYNE
jgi:hypothetical protein